MGKHPLPTQTGATPGAEQNPQQDYQDGFHGFPASPTTGFGAQGRSRNNISLYALLMTTFASVLSSGMHFQAMPLPPLPLPVPSLSVQLSRQGTAVPTARVATCAPLRLASPDGRGGSREGSWHRGGGREALQEMKG